MAHRTSVLAILAAAVALGPLVSAEPFDPDDYVVADLSGTRTDGSTPDGITASDGWINHFQIDWTVTPDDPAPNGYDLWRYDYSVSAGTPVWDGDELTDVGQAMSHWILEVSPFVTEDNWDDYFLFDDSTPFDSGLYEFGDFASGSDNPGIPGAIHGFKFNTTEDQQENEWPIDFSFWSSQRPVWGNFYAKDGGVEGIDAYAYNEGFLLDPVDVTDGDYTAWIATPDTEPGVYIPEPGTAVLAIGAVLAGVFARRHRRKEQG